MAENKGKTMWGKKFRVVPKGLSEKDVVTFVESLMTQYHESIEKLEHLDALRELANRSVDDAETFAAKLREEVKKEVEDHAASVVEEGKHRAREIVEEAEGMAASLKEAAQKEADKTVAKFISDAKKEAKNLISEGQSSVDAVIEEAKAEVESRYAGLISEAEEKAQTIIENAETQASESERTSGYTISKAERQAEEVLREAEEAALEVVRSRLAAASDEGRGKAPPVLRWSPVPGAQRYGLYVSRPPYGEDNLVFVREDLSDTTITLPIELEPGVAYQWTVRGGQLRWVGSLRSATRSGDLESASRPFLRRFSKQLYTGIGDAGVGHIVPQHIAQLHHGAHDALHLHGSASL